MADPKLVAGVRHANAWTVADLAGEIDYSRARDLRLELDPLLQSIQKPALGLVLNLAQVAYMDSTALATLVALRKHLAERSAKLRICGLNPQVNGLVKMTQLNRVLETFTDEKEAVQ